jgi:hypothetical protein
MTDYEILRVDTKTMMAALHREPAPSELLVAYLLARNIRYEDDLVDQLFNSSEKRLARVLLLLAHFGKEAIPETVVPQISQETSRHGWDDALACELLYEPVLFRWNKKQASLIIRVPAMVETGLILRQG